MPLQHDLPVLAAFDFGTAVSIIFLLIAFISWILQAVSENKPAGGRRPPRPQQPGQRPRRNPELQSEIDRFLTQVRQRGGTPPAEQGGPPPPRPVPDHSPRRPVAPQNQPSGTTQPVAPRPPQRKPKQESRNQRRQTQAGGQDSSPDRTSQRTAFKSIEQHHLDSEVSERHLKNLESHIRDRPGVPDAVEESAKTIEAMGVSMGGVSERPPESKATHPVLDAFRDPTQLRNAIIMLEVLGRPKALQRSTDR